MRSKRSPIAGLTGFAIVIPTSSPPNGTPVSIVERHLADSKHKYELYFNLLHSKMEEHGIDERNTYNMDEKGFFVGIANRRKRIFSKAVWEAGERT